jgi:hypothetical protein
MSARYQRKGRFIVSFTRHCYFEFHLTRNEKMLNRSHRQKFGMKNCYATNKSERNLCGATWRCKKNFERFANNQRITHGEMFVPFKTQTKIT